MSKISEFSKEYKEKLLVYCHKIAEGRGIGTGLKMNRKRRRLYKQLIADDFDPPVIHVKLAAAELWRISKETELQRKEFNVKKEAKEQELLEKMAALDEKEGLLDDNADLKPRAKEKGVFDLEFPAKEPGGKPRIKYYMPKE